MSLTLRDVSFTYPGAERPILSNVSLEVPDGRSVAITAPSGRGKSTLLSIAGFLLAPDRGEVLIDGHPQTPRSAGRMLGDKVQWIFQTVNLLPRRSVVDNVALPAVAHGMPRDAAEACARELLQAVGVHAVDREARTLSGGQGQRVGVARALITQPRLLLADEPTANLDARTAEGVAAVLFAAPNCTLLVATHDQTVASFATVAMSFDDISPR